MSLWLLVFAAQAYAVPSFQEVKNSFKKSDAALLDRHGKVIHELRIDPKCRRLEWTGLKDISPSLLRAVIYSEDKRFYGHRGVDWKAVGSALVKNLFAKSSIGASTITMQLASLLDSKLRPRKSKKTLSQKWDQMKAAKEIETGWTKDNILEAYLNLVTFRGELQGISAASRGLFDKEPSGLNDKESLILASLIRSPNATIENVSKRACLLGTSLNSGIGCEDIRLLAEKSLIAPFLIKQKGALAPHVAYALMKDGSGSAVSTIDGELQRFSLEVLRHHLNSVRSQHVRDGAVLVVENRTGEILAYVAGIGSGSTARYVDGIRARRQAGSTLKPFLYATAFEKKLLTPASIINDSPFEISTAMGIYKPENYEDDFKGLVSARTALASSLNVPAVRTLSLVGVGDFVLKLRHLGFQHLEGDDYYGPSLALGSADVSLWELVNAYRALANRGIAGELSLTFEKKEKRVKRIFSEDAVFLVSDIISDRAARSATFGLENPLSTKFWSAVKTGTSKDMRDNWCIGYSEKYTVGIWVGNFGGEPMWNVSGVTGAAPVWLEIMNYLHHNPEYRPQPPFGVILKKVRFPYEAEPDRDEWFVRETEPISLAANELSVPSQIKDQGHLITYPSTGTVIALDPDIPEEHQKIFFDARTDNKKFFWLLDDMKIGISGEPLAWIPQKGRYTLSLVDAQDRIVDSIEFEVKGSYLH